MGTWIKRCELHGINEGSTKERNPLTCQKQHETIKKTARLPAVVAQCRGSDGMFDDESVEMKTPDNTEELAHRNQAVRIEENADRHHVLMC